MTQEERYKYMTEGDIHKIIPHLAIPTIITMLITSIYNMADTYFVGKIDTNASAAVGIIFSIMAMIQAIGFTLGMGCGNYVSRLLGKKDIELASHVSSTIFFTSIGVGVIFATICLSFLSGLIVFLGAIPEVKPYAMDYARFIILAAPIMMGSFMLNNLLRAQGNAVKSMIGICTGGIINMFLDPLLIFTCDLGITGAALSTALSQLISFSILLYMVQTSKNSIHISHTNFKPSKNIYLNVLHTGLPSLFRQGLASISSIVLNNVAGPYGSAAIAAVSIVNRFMMMIYSSVIGFGQGFQPVCGFNYGAKKYDRVLKAYYFCMKVAICILAILGTISFIWARPIVTLIKDNDPVVIDIATKALRYQCITLPLQGIMISSQFMIQSIGYGIRASLIAMGRQGLFLIPAYFILPYFFGLTGILIGQPVSDTITVLMALIISRTVIKEIKNKAKELDYGIKSQ